MTTYSTPRYTTKRSENICSDKNFYMNVHYNVVHNSQKVETTQMSINWWMDKQNMVYPYNMILSGLKQDWITDSC